MTTAGSNAHIGIVIEAQDRVSRPVQNISRSLRRNLGQSLRSAALSMISFTSILSAVGLSITGIVVLFKNWVGSIITANRAMSALSVRLRSAGFSADRTSTAVAGLRENLSRVAQSAIPGLDFELQKLLASFGPGTQREISNLAKDMGLLGVEAGKAMEAILLAQTGDFTAFEELFKLEPGSIESMAELRDIVQEMLDNRTAIETLWGSFKQALGDLGETITDFINDKLQPLLDAFDPIIEAWRTRDWMELAQVGTNMGVQLLLGLLGYLLGDNVRGLLTAALNLKWSKVLEKAIDILEAVGQAIGRTIVNGILFFIAGPFGFLVEVPLWNKIKETIGNILPNIFQGGWNLGKRLVEGLIAGLKTNLQRAADWAIRQVNKIIDKLNEAPFVNIRRIGGVSIGGGPALGSAPGSAAGSGPNATAPSSPRGSAPNATATTVTIPISIGNRKIETVVLEILNGQVRQRLPGLGAG